MKESNEIKVLKNYIRELYNEPPVVLSDALKEYPCLASFGIKLQSVLWSLVDQKITKETVDLIDTGYRHIIGDFIEVVNGKHLADRSLENVKFAVQKNYLSSERFEATEIVNQLNSENNELKMHISELAAENDILRSKNEQLTEYVDIYMKSFEDKQHENLVLKEEIRDLKNDLIEENNLVQKLKTTINDKNLELSDALDSIDRLKSRIRKGNNNSLASSFNVSKSTPQISGFEPKNGTSKRFKVVFDDILDILKQQTMEIASLNSLKEKSCELLFRQKDLLYLHERNKKTILKESISLVYSSNHEIQRLEMSDIKSIIENYYDEIITTKNEPCFEEFISNTLSIRQDLKLDIPSFMKHVESQLFEINTILNSIIFHRKMFSENSKNFNGLLDPIKVFVSDTCEFFNEIKRILPSNKQIGTTMNNAPKIIQTMFVELNERIKTQKDNYEKRISKIEKKIQKYQNEARNSSLKASEAMSHSEKVRIEMHSEIELLQKEKENWLRREIELKDAIENSKSIINELKTHNSLAKEENEQMSIRYEKLSEFLNVRNERIQKQLNEANNENLDLKQKIIETKNSHQKERIGLTNQYDSLLEEFHNLQQFFEDCQNQLKEYELFKSKYKKAKSLNSELYNEIEKAIIVISSLFEENKLPLTNDFVSIHMFRNTYEKLLQFVK